MTGLAASTAPWIARQRAALAAQPGQALLLHGPSGLGQYALAESLAALWLCEQPVAGEGEGAAPDQACGQCASCHLLGAHTHPDLRVLMPEAVMQALDWPLSEKAQQELDDKKRKPSREIRIDAMRDAIEFAQRTSARGRAKVVLVYPAERMNHVTANALLKTLEEPPGELRFVLATEAAHRLLPTIRSRCLSHAMAWPVADEAQSWLASQGLAPADALAWLRAAGGRPEEALKMAQSGLSVAQWRLFPQAMARGDTTSVADWGPAQLVDALQKLAHDLAATRSGAEPRFFEPGALPKPPGWPALAQWHKDLVATASRVEHPFNPGLMLEALVSQARTALHSKP